MRLLVCTKPDQEEALVPALDLKEHWPASFRWFPVSHDCSYVKHAGLWLGVLHSNRFRFSPFVGLKRSSICNEFYQSAQFVFYLLVLPHKAEPTGTLLLLVHCVCVCVRAY